MFEEIEKSVKSRLWDLKTTPFMSSFFISFLFFNKEYLLLYFSEYDIDKKLSNLNGYELDILSPLMFGVLYVFVYPVIFWGFYSFTLLMNEKHNTTKQRIQKNRLLTLEDSIEIKKENEQYKEDIEKYIESIKLKEDEIILKEQNLLDEYNKKDEKLLSDFKEKLSVYEKQISDLETKLKSSNDLLSKEKKEKINLQKEVKSLDQNKNSKPIPSKFVSEIMEESNKKKLNLIQSLSDEEKCILQVFHDDHSYLQKENLNDILKSNYKLKQGKIDLLLKQLDTKKLLGFKYPNYSLTEYGLEIVNELFD